MTQHFYEDPYVHFNTRYYGVFRFKEIILILKLLLMSSTFDFYIETCFMDLRWKDETSFKFWSC